MLSLQVSPASGYYNLLKTMEKVSILGVFPRLQIDKSAYK